MIASILVIVAGVILIRWGINCIIGGLGGLGVGSMLKKGGDEADD